MIGCWVRFAGTSGLRANDYLLSLLLAYACEVTSLWQLAHDREYGRAIV